MTSLRSRLLAALVALPCTLAPSAAQGALRAGFAREDITPVLGAEPVWMAGFGQGRRASAVRDPLEAHAIVLADGETRIALVTVDLIGLFRASVERVRAELADIDGLEYVLVSSTHGHEGPDTMGLWGPNPLKSGVDPGYLARAEASIVRAVRAAEQRLEPAVAYYAAARDAALLADRRLPVALDDELRVLLFRSRLGMPIGLAVQWNCHPETLASQNTEITPDFPHDTRRHLEAALACPVAYFSGAVGGMMTTLGLEVRDASGSALPEGSFAKKTRYGELVGELAELALLDAHAIELTPMSIARRALFVPQDNKGYTAMFLAGVVERDAFRWSGSPSAAEPIHGRIALGRMALETEVAVLRLGGFTAVAIPGELYPELATGAIQTPQDPGADFQGAPCEPALLAALGTQPRFLIGLANDELGYILPRSQWDDEPPFCYGRAKSQYGEVNSLGPETAPILCAALDELLRR